MNQGQNLEFPFWDDEDIRQSCMEWYNNSFLVIPSNHTGSCLFEAFGDPETARMEIVNHIEANWNEYKNFCIEEDYLDKMKLPGSYGGTAEIQAYTQIHNRNIIIIQAQTQRILCEWIVNDQQYIFLELAPNPDSEFNQVMNYNRYNKLVPKTDEFIILHDLHAFQKNLANLKCQAKVNLLSTPKQAFQDRSKTYILSSKQTPLKDTQLLFRSCLKGSNSENKKIKKSVSFKDWDNQNNQGDDEEIELKFEIVDQKPRQNIQLVQSALNEQPIGIQKKKQKKKQIAYKSKRKIEEEQQLLIIQKRKQIYDDQTSDIDTLLKKYKK